MVKENADRLKQALVDSHNLAKRLEQPGFPLDDLEHLQNWQRHRLAGSYEDLISHKRYREAGEFFLDELYGGLNFRERDQQMERVLPVMVRMLPDYMLLVLAEAFELQALSLEFDIDMTMAMRAAGWHELNLERYGVIYRASGRDAGRQKQIELIRHLGLALNELVRHRLVVYLVRTLRGAARAAGFGLLQSFLEHGLSAFRRMGDGTEFVETIYTRELESSRRLFAGDDHPFDVQPSSKLQPK